LFNKKPEFFFIGSEEREKKEKLLRQAAGLGLYFFQGIANVLRAGVAMCVFAQFTARLTGA